VDRARIHDRLRERRGADRGDVGGKEESGRAEVAGTPARQGAGGPRGHACGRAGARVAAWWPGMPAGLELRRGGSDAAWAAWMPGWNPIGQEGRDARSPGGQEGCSLAARMLAGIRSSRDGRDARTPGGPEAHAVTLAVERDRGQLPGGQEDRGWGQVSLSSQQLAS
jgi:hypothetical protein